ncbi:MULTISPECIES: hypothetical protein [unclassified Streptomyces]|uniref:hypothetical protein n=1 Tax=unclassified Streptomyces TaxID=2593676 RepID=UPI001660264B|nr:MULTISPECIES: hypothetical protein [unclassified Streptomyces]MBD0706861.1 hypothetical protein [Streptomyces sp. CBMA291]MBD0714997.1 hypothetical protein [Streptomyces sp. CBMA370]
MAISPEELPNTLSAAAKAAPAWQAAGATVRFVLSEPAADLTLDPAGELTDAEPTHVLRISYPDLDDLAAGRRTFLRTVTSRRVSSHGPVMQTFAVGQALTTFALPR